MKIWITVALAAVLGAGFISCSDSEAPPPQGTACVINSECKNPLSCTFGRCHVQCQQAGDCPAGQRCVNVPGGNVCQLPQDKQCLYNSDCKPAEAMLKCAADFQCRNECVTAADCATNTQVCVAPGVCAEPGELDATGMLKPGLPPMSTSDAGVPATNDGAMMSPMDGPTSTPMGDGGPTATDAANNSPAPVSGIVVDKPIVRQGEINITITVTGTNLDNPRELSLGDLNATVKPGATSAMFQVGVSVPHGVALGAKPFSFRTDGGVGGMAALVTVSAITAGPAGADGNRGTSDNPFRSFKQAVAVADTGDTIQLLDGTYDATSGEDWKAELPDGITVLGQGPATKLVGPGASGGSVSVDGLVFRGSASVKKLSVGFFRYNVLVNKEGQKLAFEDVENTGSRSYAVHIQAAAKNAEVTFAGAGNDINKCASYCVYAQADGAKLSITSGQVQSLTQHAVYLYSADMNVTIDGVSMSAGTAYAAVATAGSGKNIALVVKNAMLKNYLYFRLPTGSLEVSNTTIEIDQTQPCIEFDGVTLKVTDSVLKGNPYYGVQQLGGEAVVRGTKVMAYRYYGYYITKGKLDLGNALAAGNNEFTHQEANGRYGLYDGRQLAADPITISNTSFNGNVPPMKTETGPVNEANRYRIQTTGNTIQFSLI